MNLVPLQLAPTYLSNLELVAMLDGLTNQRLAALETRGDETYLAIIDQHLGPLVFELACRISRHHDGEGPNPTAPWWEGLRSTTREIRRLADISVPLDAVGWTANRTARSGVRSGACPFCGGNDIPRPLGNRSDRFNVFPSDGSRDGRAWCRRCGYSADVISLYRDLLRVGFAQAIEDLAYNAGVLVNQPDASVLSVVADNVDRALRMEAT